MQADRATDLPNHGMAVILNRDLHSLSTRQIDIIDIDGALLASPCIAQVFSISRDKLRNQSSQTAEQRPENTHYILRPKIQQLGKLAISDGVRASSLVSASELL